MSLLENVIGEKTAQRAGLINPLLPLNGLSSRNGMNPPFIPEKHYILHFYHFIVFETSRLLIWLPATAVTDYEQPRSSTMIRQLFMALTQSQIQQ